MLLAQLALCVIPAAATDAPEAAAVAAPAPARVDVWQNISACTELHDNRGTKDPWGKSGEYLKFLGVAPTMEACADSAVAWKNSSDASQRCLSTCWWHTPQNQSVLNQCYCRVTPTWMPLPSPEADSAVLEWPCASAGDCSYNGRCAATGGGCECAAGWTGVRCGELALLPVNRSAPGFRDVTSDGRNVSSWGSPILWDEESQKWHGWASSMTHGCGINAWETNSEIVHIIGDAPTGPFARAEVFAPPFAHEPDVVRGPRGEWVML